MEIKIKIIDKKEEAIIKNISVLNYKTKIMDLSNSYNIIGLLNKKKEFIQLNKIYFEFFENNSEYYIIENINDNLYKKYEENLFDIINEITCVDDFLKKSSKYIKIIFHLNFKINLKVNKYFCCFLDIIDFAYIISKKRDEFSLNIISIYSQKEKFTEVYFEKDENYLNRIFLSAIRILNNSSIKSISTNQSFIYKENNIEKNDILNYLKEKIRNKVKIEKIIYYFILIEKHFEEIFPNIKKISEESNIIFFFDNFNLNYKYEEIDNYFLENIIIFLKEINFLIDDINYYSNINSNNKLNTIWKELVLLYSNKENNFVEILINNEIKEYNDNNFSSLKSQMSNKKNNLDENYSSNNKKMLFTFKNIQSGYLENPSMRKFFNSSKKKNSEENIQENSIKNNLYLKKISSFNNKENSTNSINSLDNNLFNLINKLQLKNNMTFCQIALIDYYSEYENGYEFNNFFCKLSEINNYCKNEKNFEVKLINNIKEFLTEKWTKSLNTDDKNILNLIENNKFSEYFIEFNNTKDYHKLIKKWKKELFMDNQFYFYQSFDDDSQIMKNNFSNIIKQYNDQNINTKRFLLDNRIIYNLFLKENNFDIKNLKIKKIEDFINQDDISSEKDMQDVLKIFNNNIIFNIKIFVINSLKKEKFKKLFIEFNFKEEYRDLLNKINYTKPFNILTIFEIIIIIDNNYNNLNMKYLIIDMINYEKNNQEKNIIILEYLIQILLKYIKSNDNNEFFTNEKSNYYISLIYKLDCWLMSVLEFFSISINFDELIENLFLMFQLDYINKINVFEAKNLKEIQKFWIEKIVYDKSIKKKLLFLNYIGYNEIYFNFININKFKNIKFFIDDLVNSNKYNLIIKWIQNKCETCLNTSCEDIFIDKKYIKNFIYTKNKYFYQIIFKILDNSTSIIKHFINFTFDKWGIQNRIPNFNIHKNNWVNYLNSNKINEKDFNTLVSKIVNDNKNNSSLGEF